MSTWVTHIPGKTAENDPFHKYVEWEMGGSTIYMPTFNKNKDSLKADINGTYEGTTPDDDTHYDDYHAYSVGEQKPRTLSMTTTTMRWMRAKVR